MKRILSIVMLITVLLVGFQNCGGVAQLPVSLGGNSSTLLSTSNINFPFTWSTDTGNFDHVQKATPRTAIIDLADSVCFLYAGQINISKEECSKIIQMDPSFINLFHNFKKGYESFEQFESDSINELIEFDMARGNACLLYIDSNQIKISNSPNIGFVRPDSDFTTAANQIYAVIASSEDCANSIQEAPAIGVTQ